LFKGEFRIGGFVEAERGKGADIRGAGLSSRGLETEAQGRVQVVEGYEGGVALRVRVVLGSEGELLYTACMPPRCACPARCAKLMTIKVLAPRNDSHAPNDGKGAGVEDRRGAPEIRG